MDSRQWVARVTTRVAVVVGIGTAFACPGLAQQANVSGADRSPKVQVADHLDSGDPAKVAQALRHMTEQRGPRCGKRIAGRMQRGLPTDLLLLAFDGVVACHHLPSASSIVPSFFVHRDAGVRARAVRAAGELGLKAASPRLLHLLDDQDAEVRASAALALVALGARSQRNALLQLWNQGSPEAGDVLAALATPADLRHLLAPLAKGDLLRVTKVLEQLVGRTDWPLAKRLSMIDALQSTGLAAARGTLQHWGQTLDNRKLKRAAAEAARSMQADPDATTERAPTGISHGTLATARGGRS